MLFPLPSRTVASILFFIHAAILTSAAPIGEYPTRHVLQKRVSELLERVDAGILPLLNGTSSSPSTSDILALAAGLAETADSGTVINVNIGDTIINTTPNEADPTDDTTIDDELDDSKDDDTAPKSKSKSSKSKSSDEDEDEELDDLSKRQKDDDDEKEDKKDDSEDLEDIDLDPEIGDAIGNATTDGKSKVKITITTAQKIDIETTTDDSDSPAEE